MAMKSEWRLGVLREDGGNHFYLYRLRDAEKEDSGSNREYDKRRFSNATIAEMVMEEMNEEGGGEDDCGSAG